MTSTWQLAKRSLKGMDMLDAVIEVLYGIEQKNSGKISGSNQEVDARLDLGYELLQTLVSAAYAQVSRAGYNDLFILKIMEKLEQETGQSPSTLADTIQGYSFEMKEHSPSPQVMTFFETLSDILAKQTSKSVDELSTSLH